MDHGTTMDMYVKNAQLDSSMIVAMKLAGLFDAGLKNIFCMCWALSRHLTGTRDVQNRVSQAPVLKTLAVCLDIFDVIQTYMWTFYISSVQTMRVDWYRQALEALHF